MSKHHTARTAVVATLAGLGIVLTGCGGSGGEPAAAPSNPPAVTVSSTKPAAAESSIDGHQVLSAVNVLEGFQAAKLPVRNDRYNDANCESMQLGCIELLTTDDISIYTFADQGAQQTFAESLGEDGYSSGNVVLSYLAARTPQALRPKYGKVLDGLE